MRTKGQAARAALSAAATALLLAACGGDGGDSATSPSEYYPLATGNRWVADDGSDETVTGQATVAGQRWWVVSGADGDGYLQSDSAGVRFYTPADGNLPAFTSTLLRAPVVVGDRYNVSRVQGTTFDVDNNGVNDDFDVRLDAEVVGRETVSTPAGTFTEVLRVRVTTLGDYVLRPSGTRQTYATGSADYWYAPGVGPVKYAGSSTVLGQVETFAAQLTGYRVGNRTGGTLPSP